MKLIRHSIFETNSSSTHSLTMCMKDTYDKWVNGELFYFMEDNKFYNDEEHMIMVKKAVIDSQIEYSGKRLEDEEGNFIGYDSKYTYKGITTSKKEDHYTQENLDGITDYMIQQAYEDNYISSYDVPMSYEEYENYISDYESYYEAFETPDNEIVVGFGYYGQDY